LEMQALARIDHPGVVGILDVGELADGSPFLVIQHIPGVSLRTLLSAGAIPPGRAAVILRGLGGALGAAHKAGVAHQDLKPENILLQAPRDGSETVKLIDFGIAKIDQSEVEGVTTIMVAGTVKYMAPEQFEGRNSPAADVYALGLIAQEMLAGTLEASAPLTGMRRVARLIGSALERDPAGRPVDVRAWCENVARALGRPGFLYRRSIALTAAALLLVATSVLGSRLLAAPPRVIEKVGAFDPLSEGFVTHGDIAGTVAMNAARDGYDGWQVFTRSQGIYHRRLSRAQKRAALERGWLLRARGRPTEGMTFASADFFGYGKRFEICLYRQVDRTVLVRLTTQVVPTFQGLETRIPDDGQNHEYELRYDNGRQTADLWIDGAKLLRDYRGVSDFQDPQDDWGIAFGASNYKSERSEGAFQSVRFEINP